MDLPQIRLQSNFGQIEINTIKPLLEMEQPKPDVNIEQRSAELVINRTPSRLTIDQTKAREDVDLKSIFRRTQEAAQKGYQDLLSGIARVSQDGDELMMIENNGNAIVDQAKRNSEPPIYDVNIGWVPSAGSVKIDYIPGKQDISWKVNKPIIEIQARRPSVNYTPGNTVVKMKVYPSLSIEFINLWRDKGNYEQSI